MLSIVNVGYFILAMFTCKCSWQFFSFIYLMEVKMIENKTKKEDWKARFSLKDLTKLI